MKVRIASANDLQIIVEIYNQAVDEKYCTADTEHISLGSYNDWFKQHSEKDYPIFVCEIGGILCGWCSLSPYRSGRKALRTVAEISYYVHKDFRKMKVGDTLIYHAILLSKKFGFRNLIAFILEPNKKSTNLIMKHGFKLWGKLHDIAIFEDKCFSHLNIWIKS